MIHVIFGGLTQEQINSIVIPTDKELKPVEVNKASDFSTLCRLLDSKNSNLVVHNLDRDMVNGEVDRITGRSRHMQYIIEYNPDDGQDYGRMIQSTLKI